MMSHLRLFRRFAAPLPVLVVAMTAVTAVLGPDEVDAQSNTVAVGTAAGV